jgi:4-hydroxyphenylpyruvate dioxygenase
MSIDHVAQALPVGRMDNFVLFYKALFDFKAEQLWEIPDAMGLVQSRAMVSDGYAVRLPLNISESRETTTGRFLTTFSGAGVQHIAFGSSDILRAIEQLTARGARLLPIPGNYYDDIAARWGLPDAQIAALQAQNILFDRDANGDFLHAYTDAFDDRFFFEIVQRIAGYQQFGAANAGIRMAAQATRRTPRPSIAGTNETG